MSAPYRNHPDCSMLDVVLYGYDERGQLTLEERHFPSLRQLSAFFASGDGLRWRWAEVETVSAGGERQILHYSADALRGMIVASSLNPSAN